MSGGFDPERWHTILSAEAMVADVAAVTEAELAVAEAHHGVVYPEAYKWVLFNYPGVELAGRWVRIGNSEHNKYFVLWATDSIHAPRLEAPHDIEWHGDRDGMGADVVAWEKRLWCHGLYGGWPHTYCLDFDFDPVDPPVVIYDWDGSWGDGGGRRGRGGKISFLCDSFVDLIELPVDDAETNEPAWEPPSQQREREWFDWRFERLSPAWDKLD